MFHVIRYLFSSFEMKPLGKHEFKIRNKPDDVLHPLSTVTLEASKVRSKNQQIQDLILKC